MRKTETQRDFDTQRVVQYELPGGWQVVAGRTDLDNDYVSLQAARPMDWWFHVRGMPGSHVILLVSAGEETDTDALKEAAAIAAFHSKARSGGIVSVSCTRAQYVTKPRGAKTGTVQIRKEKVLQVRPMTLDQIAEMKNRRSRSLDGQLT
jgi:predicted ribosome quality control (RQC) complex YloA/Tae2 family protein